MKPIRILKITDLTIQIQSLAVPLVYRAYFAHDSYDLFYLYIWVGGAQYLSCILNRLFLPAKFRVSGRLKYEIILAIITAVAFLLYVGCIGYFEFGIVSLIKLDTEREQER